MDNNEIMAPLFILVGSSGSGKTTLARASGLKELVSWTTRPMRQGERDGVDYFFVGQEEFDREPMVERVEFNGYTCGTPERSFMDAGIIVAEPKGAVQLWRHGLTVGRECRIVGLRVSEETCCDRMLQRGDAFEKVKARLENDAKVFKDFERICDTIIVNEWPHDGAPSLKRYIESELKQQTRRLALLHDD